MRGRPTKSAIRQNIIEILNLIKKGHGYDIYKIYIKIFPKVTMRSIYYHLKKGTALNEFKIEKAEPVKGTYSWGTEAEKKVYVLGQNAKPKGDPRIKEYLEKKNA